MATYTFTTPTVSEGPAGGHRLFMFRHLNKGITIIKTGGQYYQARYLVDDGTQPYEELYRGGHIHTGISWATKAAMIAANIGITESNFVAE